MAKNLTETAANPTVPAATQKTPPDLTKPNIKAAIDVGSKLIAGNGTKADAARAMYELISGEDKEVIVAAFVAGATLTEKGALTYWYNCRRRASKSAK